MGKALILPGTGIQVFKFIPDAILYRPVKAGGSQERIIVEDHELAAFTKVNVEFQARRSQVLRQVKGLHGVFWGQGRTAPMGKKERPGMFRQEGQAAAQG
jgi:hypothetical protein